MPTKFYTSREVAKILDVCPNSLRKWADNGEINYIRTKSGQRRYDVESYIGKSTSSITICYCRVSSHKQRDDLERQVEFLRNQYPNAEFIKDIGSGLNFKRKGLKTILERAMSGTHITLVVAHRDRLARFGIDLIRQVIEQSGGKLVVLDETFLSPEQELANDLLNVQSCFIPKTAISDNGIYPRISGKDLKFIESFPEEVLDSRLVWRAGKYFLTIPTKQRVSYGENQARVVAIDPGVRVFSTFYGTDSCGFLGQGDFSRIQRLAHHLDDLISRMSKVTNKQKLRKMKLAAARMREKIKNLVDELHHKVALFLVTNFDCILLPTFETQQMVGKSHRKIQNKTVRSLLSFAHYRFKTFLKHKAFEFGKKVIDVCEAYTSKTHPETGEVKKVGSAKRIKLLNGQWINRDIVGARNILLRALVDQPHCFLVAVNKCE